jgi:iron complex outermembrane recepter protein
MRSRALRLGLLFAAASTTAGAWAQVVPPVSSEPAATDKLQDIVVTAQKRSERLQDVPIAITAVGRQAIEARQIESTVDLPAIAPGLNVRVTNGLFQPTIRGIGTSASFTENPTSLYVDGVYIVDQRLALTDLNDVEQVAVLKGPQGTLFGRNSTAGVIQITTRRPDDATHLEAGVSLDNYATVRTDGYLSGGLAPGLTASLSAHYASQGEGWGRNLTRGEDAGILRHDFSIRGKLVFAPGSDTTFTLIGEHFNSQFDGGANRPFPGTTFAYPGFAPTQSNYDTYAGTNKVVQNEGNLGSLTFEQDFSFAKLLSISSLQHANSRTLFDIDGVAAPLFFVSIPNAPSTAFTQELQLGSKGDPVFSWLIGGFYINNKQQVDPSTSYVRPPFFPAPVVLVRDSTQRTESIAGFAQGTLRLADTTRITGGIRYTYENRDFDGIQTVAINGGKPAGAPVVASTSVDKPTFRASLDHNFTPDVLGYVSFNTGFKSGGYNLLAPTSPPYEPETIKAVEGGLKTELFDRRVRLNVAAFYNDYTNIQVSQIINNVTVISNAASARVYGADIDFEAHVAPGLTLSSALELLHARFQQFDNAQLVIPLPTGGAAITSASAAGNRLPLSQDVSLNGAIDYDFEAGGAAGHFNISAAYQGRYFFEPDNVLEQPGYVMLNSSLKFTLPGTRISLTVFGKNLLNEYVITTVSSTRPALIAIDAFAPRTFGVEARYTF